MPVRVRSASMQPNSPLHLAALLGPASPALRSPQVNAMVLDLSFVDSYFGGERSAAASRSFGREGAPLAAERGLRWMDRRLVARGGRSRLSVRSWRRPSGALGGSIRPCAELAGSPSGARGGGPHASRSMGSARGSRTASCRAGLALCSRRSQTLPRVGAALRASLGGDFDRGASAEAGTMAVFGPADDRLTETSRADNALRHWFGFFVRAFEVSSRWENLTVRCTCRFSSGQPRRGRVWPCGARR